ncbi:MAG: DUF1097 domain-containing protein [Halobacteriales archaeon]
MRVIDRQGLARWNRRWALAAVFGLVSVPWTYAFVVSGIPLWPSFVASAAYFAADEGPRGFGRATAGVLAGIAYGAATLAVVAGLGGGVAALSLAVGAAMFLASLHAFAPAVFFPPGLFLGYATLFSVHAAGARALGLGGLPGETIAAALAMGIGAAIGLAADGASARLRTAG